MSDGNEYKQKAKVMNHILPVVTAAVMLATPALAGMPAKNDVSDDMNRVFPQAIQEAMGPAKEPAAETETAVAENGGSLLADAVIIDGETSGKAPKGAHLPNDTAATSRDEVTDRVQHESLSRTGATLPETGTGTQHEMQRQVNPNRRS